MHGIFIPSARDSHELLRAYTADMDWAVEKAIPGPICLTWKHRRHIANRIQGERND